MKPSQRINVILPDKRVGGVTLFAAIGDALVEPVYMTGPSTTIEQVLRFVPLLLQNLTP